MPSKQAKRILTVVVKRMIDTDPDTRWMGEYSSNPTSFASIDREHDSDCPQFWANGTDEDGEIRDCNCSGGNRERNEYQYFNPSFNYVDKHGNPTGNLPEDEVRKYTRQDYERMESLQRGNWSFIGIRAEATVQLTGDLTQHLSSGGLWGIESDSDKSYFSEVEQEQLAELREELHAAGFSKRAISAAFRDVAHKDE